MGIKRGTIIWSVLGIDTDKSMKEVIIYGRNAKKEEKAFRMWTQEHIEFSSKKHYNKACFKCLGEVKDYRPKYVPKEPTHLATLIENGEILDVQCTKNAIYFNSFGETTSTEFCVGFFGVKLELFKRRD